MGKATPEGRVKRAVRQILERRRIFFTMPVASAFGRAGVPDFLCCVDGRFLAIETKAKGRKPTKLQQYTLERIAHAGGIALVVDEHSVLQLDEFLDRVMDSGNRVGMLQ